MKVQTSALRNTTADPWIEIMNRDAAAGAIADNTVAIAITDGPCPYGLLGEKGLRADDTALHEWARAQWVSASYVAVRQLGGQIVQLAQCLGGLYGPMALTESYTHGVNPLHVAARQAHNDELKLRVQRAVRHIENAVRKHEGLTLLGGSFEVEEGAWQPHPFEVIAAVPDEACMFCNEAVYYANGWRHKSTGQAAIFRAVACESCVGSGRGRGDGLCGSCQGRRVRSIEDHVAQPAEAPEPAEVGA